MPKVATLEELLKFFIDNRDYFCAHYLNQGEFVDWLENDEDGFPKYLVLNNELSILMEDENIRLMYETAITGASLRPDINEEYEEPEESGLVGGNDFLMAEFLRKYPNIAGFFLANLEKFQELVTAWDFWELPDEMEMYALDDEGCDEDEKIEKLSKFFIQNDDFFSEPFLNKSQFSNWLKADKQNFEKYCELNYEFLILMDSQGRLEYEATVGKALHPNTKSYNVKQEERLVDKKTRNISRLLGNNGKVRDFLFENIMELRLLILHRFIFKFMGFFSEFFENKVEFGVWLEKYKDISKVSDNLISKLHKLMALITQLQCKILIRRIAQNLDYSGSRNDKSLDENYFLLTKFLRKNPNIEAVLLRNRNELSLLILVRYFHVHNDFFFAPFVNDKKLAAWLANDCRSQKYKELNSEFFELMDDKRRFEYQFAIMGDAPHSKAKDPLIRIRLNGALVHGNCFLIAKFLEKNPHIRSFLLLNFERLNELVAAWDQWNLRNKMEVAAVNMTGKHQRVTFFSGTIGTKRKEGKQEIDASELKKVKLCTSDELAVDMDLLASPTLSQI